MSEPFEIEKRRCLACGESVEIVWAPHPCGGSYVLDVLGECSAAPGEFHAIDGPTDRPKP